MLHGWIILDKPVGLGSTQAVSAVKRLLREAGEPKTKVGHGGTLDPLASGVLPIALGEATKLAGRMLDATKAYEFTIRFGEETDTLDAEGEVVATSDVRPTLEQVEAVLPRFTGEIEQVPPAYSALKIGGKRAYERARAGEDGRVERRATSRCTTLRFASPGSGGPTPGRKRDSRAAAGMMEDHPFRHRLQRHLHPQPRPRHRPRLNTVGHVTMLRRTRAGPFSLEQAISLDFLEEAAKARATDGAVLPLIAALDDIPALPVTPDQAQLLRHGQKLVRVPRSAGALHWRSWRELRSLWSKPRPTASGSSGGSTFKRTGVTRCRLPPSASEG